MILENFNQVRRSLEEETGEGDLEEIGVSPSLYLPGNNDRRKVNSVVVDVNVFDNCFDSISRTSFPLNNPQREEYREAWGRNSLPLYDHFGYFIDEVSPQENIEILKRIKSRDINLYCPDHLRDCLSLENDDYHEGFTESTKNMQALLEEEFEDLEVKDEMGLTGEKYRTHKVCGDEDDYIASKVRELPGLNPVVTYDSDFIMKDGIMALSPRSMYETIKGREKCY